MVCKKGIQFFILVCLVLPVFVSAQDSVIIIGGKEGWPQLSVSHNIVSGKGRFGYEAKIVASNEKQADSNTDLLLNFEQDAVVDVSGKYSVISNSIRPSPKSAMGKKSGLSSGTKGLVLKGSPSSIFGSSGYKGSLTISFWMYPVLAESGEIIFSWRSSRNSLVYSTYQTITASVFNGKMEWRFANVFVNSDEKEKEILLTGRSTLIPNTWSHHCLVYNEDDGSMEYYINGLVEDSKYATDTLSSSPSVYRLFLGVPADIAVCPKFNGLIDDFAISAVSEKVSVYIDSYSRLGGRFETQPIDTGSFASVMKSLEAEVSVPEQTGAQFFVRAGDNFYEWNDSYPPWKPVKLGEKIQGISGRYFQAAVNLYPDGNAKSTPSVTELRLLYEQSPLPLSPYLVQAKAGDSYVEVSWAQSVEGTIGGYYVYYGERPGEYLGRSAVQGTSPIDAGKVQSIKIAGLDNGKIYYFAVSAYSVYDQRIKSSLSKEVYARPLKE